MFGISIGRRSVTSNGNMYVILSKLFCLRRWIKQLWNVLTSISWIIIKLVWSYLIIIMKKI